MISEHIISHIIPSRSSHIKPTCRATSTSKKDREIDEEREKNVRERQRKALAIATAIALLIGIAIAILTLEAKSGLQFTIRPETKCIKHVCFSQTV